MAGSIFHSDPTLPLQRFRALPAPLIAPRAARPEGGFFAPIIQFMTITPLAAQPLTHRLYLHGFRASPQSLKARTMAQRDHGRAP